MNRILLVVVVLGSLVVGGCGTTNLHIAPNGAVLAEVGSNRPLKVLGGRPATEVAVRSPEWGYCDIHLGEGLRAKVSPTAPFATVTHVRLFGYDMPDRFTLNAYCRTPGGFIATASESFRLPDEDYRRRGEKVLHYQWDLRYEEMRGQGGLLAVILTLDERYSRCEVRRDGSVVASLSTEEYSATLRIIRDPEQDYAREAVLVYRCVDHSGRVSTGMEEFSVPDSRVEKTGWEVP